MGDLVDRVTRKNQDLVSELPLTISAQYGLIDQNEFFDKRVASKDVSGYYLIENGEFAYNKSTSTDAPWGAIKRLDRYENGVLSTLYIVFGIKENNPVDSDFLVLYYSTNLWHKGIHEIAAEGARNHGLLNIAPADFFETKLMISQDIEEQNKIGKYFEELERLITLHQRNPCNLNKFMAFDWEQRKLGNVLKFQNGFNGSKERYGTGTKLISVMDILNDDFITYESIRGLADVTEEEKERFSVDFGDVLFQRSSENVEDAGRTNVYLDRKRAVFGGFVIRGKKNSDYQPEFMRYVLDTKMIRKQITTKAQGAQHINVSQETLQDVLFCLPSKEEQIRIGNYFRNLDNLITLHQRELENLQNIKKFMLGKMFV